MTKDIADITCDKTLKIKITDCTVAIQWKTVTSEVILVKCSGHVEQEPRVCASVFKLKPYCWGFTVTVTSHKPYLPSGSFLQIITRYVLNIYSCLVLSVINIFVFAQKRISNFCP